VRPSKGARHLRDPAPDETCAITRRELSSSSITRRFDGSRPAARRCTLSRGATDPSPSAAARISTIASMSKAFERKACRSNCRASPNRPFRGPARRGTRAEGHRREMPPSPGGTNLRFPARVPRPRACSPVDVDQTSVICSARAARMCRLASSRRPRLRYSQPRSRLRQKYSGSSSQGAPIEPNALFPIVAGRACEKEVALLLRLVDANGLSRTALASSARSCRSSHVPQDRPASERAPGAPGCAAGRPRPRADGPEHGRASAMRSSGRPRRARQAIDRRRVSSGLARLAETGG
jgi:hypothetical protein